MSSQSNIDTFLTYQLLQRLATPFTQWPAYKLGIIDGQGKVLRKKTTLTKQNENDAWGYFDILCANIKKIIVRYPQYQTQMAPLTQLTLPPTSASSIGSVTNYPLSYVASLFFLLKDHCEDPDDIEYITERLEYYMTKLNEDAPTNSVGGGAIAGTGGKGGEPGVPVDNAYKRANERGERKKLNLGRRVLGLINIGNRRV